MPRSFFSSKPFIPRARRHKPGPIVFRRKPGWNGVVFGNRTRSPGAARMALNKARWELWYAFGRKGTYRRTLRGDLVPRGRKPARRGGLLQFLRGRN